MFVWLLVSRVMFCHLIIILLKVYIYIYSYMYIYTASEKPLNDQSYGVLGRYGITIICK